MVQSTSEDGSIWEVVRGLVVDVKKGEEEEEEEEASVGLRDSTEEFGARDSTVRDEV